MSIEKTGDFSFSSFKLDRAGSFDEAFMPYSEKETENGNLDSQNGRFGSFMQSVGHAVATPFKSFVKGLNNFSIASPEHAPYKVQSPLSPIANIISAKSAMPAKPTIFDPLLVSATHPVAFAHIEDRRTPNKISSEPTGYPATDIATPLSGEGVLGGFEWLAPMIETGPPSIKTSHKSLNQEGLARIQSMFDSETNISKDPNFSDDSHQSVGGDSDSGPVKSVNKKPTIVEGNGGEIPKASYAIPDLTPLRSGDNNERHSIVKGLDTIPEDKELTEFYGGILAPNDRSLPVEPPAAATTRKPLPENHQSAFEKKPDGTLAMKQPADASLSSDYPRTTEDVLYSAESGQATLKEAMDIFKLELEEINAVLGLNIPIGDWRSGSDATSKGENLAPRVTVTEIDSQAD
jgi:hypothetical protein